MAIQSTRTRAVSMGRRGPSPSFGPGLWRVGALALLAALAGCRGGDRGPAVRDEPLVPASERAKEILTGVRGHAGWLEAGPARGFSEIPGQPALRPVFAAGAPERPTASVALPLRATGPVRIEDAASGAAVTARLANA